MFLEVAEIQQLTRESLTKEWSNCLSNDWMEEDQSGQSSFPLDKYYIDLELFETVKGILGKYSSCHQLILQSM